MVKGLCSMRSNTTQSNNSNIHYVHAILNRCYDVTYTTDRCGPHVYLIEKALHPKARVWTLIRVKTANV